ncbi:ubiquitin-specific protease, putative, partial [Ichthyophthirius multifiliis]
MGNNYPEGEKFFGLVNKDNICYSNSIFQALYNCELFRNQILNYNSKPNEYNIIVIVQEIFQQIANNKKKTGICNTNKIMKYVRDSNPDFRGDSHQDCHEFSIWLLNQINDIINKPYIKTKENPNPLEQKQASWLEDIFGGILTTQTQCNNCKTVTERDEAFLDISIDIDYNSSISHCIKKISEKEVLNQECKFFCDKCQTKQDAEKRSLFKKLPKTLILHLKRFKYDEKYNRMQKLMHKIAFPLDIKIST